jgi:hypothetical protein
MDVRIYFQKIRQIENTISAPFALIASLETPDGGKAGTFTEVTAATAAQLIVQGRARLANEEEVNAYAEANEQARIAAEHALAASRIQFVAVSDQEAKTPKRQKS